MDLEIIYTCASSYSEKKTEGKGRHYKEERGKKESRCNSKKTEKSLSVDEKT
jgi:hypothetical protein